jgi:hypothetical protein
VSVRTEDIGNKLTGNIGYTLIWAHALEQCVTNGTKAEIQSTLSNIGAKNLLLRSLAGY